jgi:hypothetical protein
MQAQATPPHIRLYRYMSSDAAIATLTRGALRVTRLNALNDPFEFRPGIRGIAPGREDEAQPAIESFAGSLMAHFDPTVGIICFSTSPHEPVLWGHYADKHRGVALGFDIFVNDFLFKMNYDSARPCFDAAGLPVGDGEALRLMKLVLSTKATSWAYESEYRVFIDLGDPLLRRDADGTFHRPIPSDCLKQVVIGARSEVSVERTQSALRDGGLEGVSVLKARLCHTEFKVLV